VKLIFRYSGLTGTVSRNDPPKRWQTELYGDEVPRIPNIGESVEGPDHRTYLVDSVAWAPWGESGWQEDVDDPLVSGPYVMLILRAG
jgi:hypothetical protein